MVADRQKRLQKKFEKELVKKWIKNSDPIWGDRFDNQVSGTIGMKRIIFLTFIS